MSQEALQRAIKSLVINDVYLCATSAVLASEFSAKYHEEELFVQYRHFPVAVDKGSVRKGGAISDDAPKYVNFHLDTGVRFLVFQELSGEVRDNQEPDTKAEISATFIAEYRVISDDFPDDEALEQFAHTNAMYHLWPYWREYIQNMCARMRLPSIVIPMYRPSIQWLSEAENRQQQKSPTEPG